MLPDKKQSRVDLIGWDMAMIDKCKDCGIKPRKQHKPLGFITDWAI